MGTGMGVGASRVIFRGEIGIDRIEGGAGTGAEK